MKPISHDVETPVRQGAMTKESGDANVSRRAIKQVVPKRGVHGSQTRKMVVVRYVDDGVQTGHARAHVTRFLT